MVSGVYGIKCLANDKIYIGSTNNLKRRKKEHFNNLKNRKHNKSLLEDYNKFGKDNFSFLLLYYCPIELLKEKEKEYLELYYSKGLLYNKIKDPTNHKGENNPRYGCKLSEKHKNSLKQGSLGKPSHKRKLTIAQCKEIKEWLIYLYDKKMVKEQLKGLSETFNTSQKQIDKIRKGDHWSSKELGGSIWDWLKIPKEERRKK
jgi:group I intron endonuclease